MRDLHFKKASLCFSVVPVRNLCVKLHLYLNAFGKSKKQTNKNKQQQQKTFLFDDDGEFVN